MDWTNCTKNIMKTYQPKRLTDTEKSLLIQQVIKELSGIEPDDLTTFEYRLFRKLVENPPRKGGGAENRMQD